MTWFAVTVDVLIHLICAAVMYFYARQRWGSNAWWWGAVGLLTGLVGMIVFIGFVGWQLMFQRVGEKQSTRHSERILKGRGEDQLLAREALQNPDRDGYLDQLIYEGKPGIALEQAREKLRIAHEMGDSAREKLLRRYIAELSEQLG